MTAALLLGFLFGFAAFATWRLLFPPTPPLSAAIARLQRRNELTRITSAGDEHDVSDLVGRTLGHLSGDSWPVSGCASTDSNPTCDF